MDVCQWVAIGTVLCACCVDRVDNFFDADAYWQAGQCPWTFFAFPTSLADEHGLPPDADAKSLLGELQRRGIRVGLWANAIADNTTYYACPKDDIERLNDAVVELETNGMIVILVRSVLGGLWTDEEVVRDGGVIGSMRPQW